MTFHKYALSIPIICCLTALMSCEGGQKDKEQSKDQNQQQTFQERFFNRLDQEGAPRKEFQATPNELHYKIYDSGQSQNHPEMGDVVQMDMFTSTNQNVMLVNTLLNNKYYYMQVDTPASKGDIVELLPKLTQGDSTLAWAMAEHAFTNRLPDPIEPNDTVYTYIKVHDVYNESEKIQNYLQTNDLKRQSKALKDDLYIAYRQEGNGRSISTGDSIAIHFEGYLMNEKMFNSTRIHDNPLKFVYGEKEIIKGWDIALKHLQEGDQVTLVMHSKFAYGEKGNRPVIPPFTPLIFDIEVLKVFQQPA